MGESLAAAFDEVVGGRERGDEVEEADVAFGELGAGLFGDAELTAGATEGVEAE